MKKKPTSLVTGGAGFIGSHVAEHLLRMNHRVIILDDLSGGFLKNIPKKVIFVRGSINDRKLLDKIFKKYKFDYIYHLAAYAAEGLSHFIRYFNYENNLVGSINLINQAILHDIKHFVFTSSIAVYGSSRTPMREDMTPHPEDPYGIAKYAVELDLKAAHELFGLNYTIFRAHNVYGERQNLGDPYRNVICIFITNIMDGKPVNVFGDGNQKRAFSYICDIAPYIAQAPIFRRAKNEIFNIGTDSSCSVLYLANSIAKIMGTKPYIRFLPARKEVSLAFCDHTKAKKIFKIKKNTSLEEGIKKTVVWAKKNEVLPKKNFKSIEIKKNLPVIWR